MSRLPMSRPSPAMCVALLALFVALGGSSYAAIKLPKNSVGATQIKADAVTGSKVKNGSLAAGDFKKGQLPAGVRGAVGPQGQPGAPGPQGNPGADGTAKAYGTIAFYLGVVNVGEAKGMSAANVAHPGTGIYCLGKLPFEPENIQATLGFFGGLRVTTQTSSAGSCFPPFDQAEIHTIGDNGALSNAPVFHLLIN